MLCLLVVPLVPVVLMALTLALAYVEQRLPPSKRIVDGPPVTQPRRQCDDALFRRSAVVRGCRVECAPSLSRDVEAETLATGVEANLDDLD